MLKVDRLTKRYGRRTVLDSVSFTARPGQVTALVGRDGAGKTTMLRCAVGLARPHAGRVLVRGKDVRGWGEIVKVVGSSLTATAVPPNWTGRVAVGVVADLIGLEARQADDALALLGLTEVAGKQVNSYSPSARQRLAIAVALLGNRPVLVLDEPTKDLEPVAASWVRTELTRRAARGATVLVSTRDSGQPADQTVLLESTESGALATSEKVPRHHATALV